MDGGVVSVKRGPPGILGSPAKPALKRPREDSNLGTRLRRAVLYPLSYGGFDVRKASMNPDVRDNLEVLGRPEILVVGEVGFHHDVLVTVRGNGCRPCGPNTGARSACGVVQDASQPVKNVLCHGSLTLLLGILLVPL